MKDSERSLATAAWRASGQYLAAILNDSIRFMVLEEKVVKEIIHAQKSVSAQDDSIIDHLKKPLLGQLLERAGKTLKDVNFEFVAEVICLHVAQLHLQDKLPDHPLLFVRSKRALDWHLL